MLFSSVIASLPFLPVSPGSVRTELSLLLLLLVLLCELEGVTLLPLLKQGEISVVSVWTSMLQHVRMLRGQMYEKWGIIELQIVIVFRILALPHM